MVTKRCDRLWEVDAQREGRLGVAGAESFERHRAMCADCEERHRADERLRTLGRALPVPVLDELDAKRRRARLLRDAAVGTIGARSRIRVTIAAAACAAALLVVVFAGVTRSRAVASREIEPIGVSVATALPAPFAAWVRPSTNAVWTQRRDDSTETIRLDAGTIVVVVRSQHADERLLVALPDGEIEVRGTVFEVTVNAGKTLAVDVREGLVALRLRGSGEVLLAEGETWPPRVVAAPRAPTASSPRAPAPAPVSLVAPPATIAAAPSEYDEAMRLYRARRYDDASRAFHMFAASHPSAPEAEDSAFLEASALAFAGRADAAALVAERFLDRYPRSFHAKDAAILIARVARDRGDCERARRVLGPWSTSSGADVRTALGKCEP